eukprot:g3395.t1
MSFSRNVLFSRAEDGRRRARNKERLGRRFSYGYEDVANTLRKQNDAESWYRLACMHVIGRGVQKSKHEALVWLQKAAEHGHVKALHKLCELANQGMHQGDVEAQYILACMYENGRGVDKSDSVAFRYFKEAADHGHVEAQYKLACMYENGRGVDESHYQALMYFEEAAEQGHVEAQYKLFEVANQGDVEAQYILACMYENGRGVDKSD